MSTETRKRCAVCNGEHAQSEHDQVEPVRVTLLFENAADRDYFMGQLTDGFGENEANVRPFEGSIYTVKPFPMFPEASHAV